MLHRKKNTGLRIFVGCLFALSISACSIFTPEIPEMSDSEVCVKVNELIADHANNFKQFRGARKSSNRISYMQIWNAERVFPLAKNCQIWEWSSGLTNYFCGWNESSELQAKQSHDKGADIVRECLVDKQWQSNFVHTQSGGGRTLFFQEGGKTVISIHYFKESRTILENWKTTLYVGDESNLSAAVQ